MYFQLTKKVLIQCFDPVLYYITGSPNPIAILITSMAMIPQLDTTLAQLTWKIHWGDNKKVIFRQRKALQNQSGRIGPCRKRGGGVPQIPPAFSADFQPAQGGGLFPSDPSLKSIQQLSLICAQLGLFRPQKNSAIRVLQRTLAQHHCHIASWGFISNYNCYITTLRKDLCSSLSMSNGPMISCARPFKAFKENIMECLQSVDHPSAISFF